MLISWFRFWWFKFLDFYFTKIWLTVLLVVCTEGFASQRHDSDSHLLHTRTILFISHCTLQQVLSSRFNIRRSHSRSGWHWLTIIRLVRGSRLPSRAVITVVSVIVVCLSSSIRLTDSYRSWWYGHTGYITICIRSHRGPQESFLLHRSFTSCYSPTLSDSSITIVSIIHSVISCFIGRITVVFSVICTQQCICCHPLYCCILCVARRAYFCKLCMLIACFHISY